MPTKKGTVKLRSGMRRFPHTVCRRCGEHKLDNCNGEGTMSNPTTGEYSGYWTCHNLKELTKTVWDFVRNNGGIDNWDIIPHEMVVTIKGCEYLVLACHTKKDLSLLKTPKGSITLKEEKIER